MEVYVDSSAMPNDQMAALLTALMAYLGVIMVVALIWTLLQVIASWRIYTKAGEAGWKSLIPIYSDYTMYKLTWAPLFFWVWFAVSLVSNVIYFTAEAGSALTTVASVLMLVGTVITIIQNYKLSKAFGHGVGFTIGLIFLSPIFRMILGFGGDTYQGPQ